MAGSDDRILDAALGHVTADGYDAAHVLACALELLAENWADDKRPLCPECGERRITRGAAFCKWCLQQRDAELLDKVTWWAAHGAAWRDERRAAAVADETADPT